MLATDDELKALIVTRLGLIDEGGFEKIRVVATRLRIPVDRALAERGVIPISFLLRELAMDWGVGFIDLQVLTSILMRSAPFPRNTRAGGSSSRSKRRTASSGWPCTIRATRQRSRRSNR